MRNFINRLALLAIVFAGVPRAVAADEKTSGTEATGVRHGEGGGSLNDAMSASKKEKVKPGDTYTNVDGVTIDNDSTSSGNGSITPKNGSAGCVTKVATKTGFTGSISGLDSNDVVELGSSNTTTISGTGGAIDVAGGSIISVNNTALPSGNNITVNLPSGSTATVPPGSYTIFST